MLPNTLFNSKHSFWVSILCTKEDWESILGYEISAVSPFFKTKLWLTLISSSVAQQWEPFQTPTLLGFYKMAPCDWKPWAYSIDEVINFLYMCRRLLPQIIFQDLKQKHLSIMKDGLELGYRASVKKVTLEWIYIHSGTAGLGSNFNNKAPVVLSFLLEDFCSSNFMEA